MRIAILAVALSILPLSSALATAGGPDGGYAERGAYFRIDQRSKLTVSATGVLGSSPYIGAAAVMTAVPVVIPYGAKFAIIGPGGLGQADGGWALTGTDYAFVQLSDTMSGSAGEADAWGMRASHAISMDNPLVLRDLDIPITGATAYVWYAALPRKWFALSWGEYSLENY